MCVSNRAVRWHSKVILIIGLFLGMIWRANLWTIAIGIYRHFGKPELIICSVTEKKWQFPTFSCILRLYLVGRSQKHSKGRLRTTSDLWYQKRTSKAGNLKRPGQIRFNNRFWNQEQTRLHKRYTLLLVLFPLVIRRKAIFEVVFKSRQLCQVK